jgi:hypothetical protein
MAPPRPAVEISALTPDRQFALAYLQEAFLTASELGKAPAAFACQLEALANMGVTETTLRWLVTQGFAQHLVETTKRQQAHRSFREAANLRLSPRSCFLLTKGGAGLADTMAGSGRFRLDPPHYGETGRLPHYDPKRRTLFLDGQIVKQFRVPAANQELILLSLEEENWPAHLHDPLPPRPNQNAKQRLHDTIKRLNQNHSYQAIHFQGDGTGRGVRWRLIVPRSAPHRP